MSTSAPSIGLFRFNIASPGCPDTPTGGSGSSCCKQGSCAGGQPQRRGASQPRLITSPATQRPSHPRRHSSTFAKHHQRPYKRAFSDRHPTTTIHTYNHGRPKRRTQGRRARLASDAASNRDRRDRTTQARTPNNTRPGAQVPPRPRGAKALARTKDRVPQDQGRLRCRH